MNLLELDAVGITFRTSRGDLRALDGVSLALAEGESLGVVGESGCGKTTVARTILRILPANAAPPTGRILFRGRNLLSMSEDEMRRMRCRSVALIPQSAMNALDPVYRVGAQIVEAIRTHEDCAAGEAWDRARRLFEAVGLRADLVRAYPHSFSGGMRQRAILAMVLALRPPLIVADEPTTALDVIMQDQVFAEIARMRREIGTAMILVSHDIALVAENCERIAIMYAGQVVETGPTRGVLDAPEHPYTIGLCNASADLEEDGQNLISIPGGPPELIGELRGCRFAPRCPFARNRCRQEAPSLHATGPGRRVACHFAEHAEEFRARGRVEATWEAPAGSVHA